MFQPQDHDKAKGYRTTGGGEWGTYHVLESQDNYSVHLGREVAQTEQAAKGSPADVHWPGPGGYTQDPRKTKVTLVGLYRVTLQLPQGVETHYVLAEGGAQAIGQAFCAAGVTVYQPRDSYPATAERVPLVLQGWGKQRV